MKCLKSKFEWKEYHAYPHKIIFVSKVGSNGMIKLSKTLKHFANFNFLYGDINKKIIKFPITTGKDRGNIIYRSYVGKSNRKKILKVYLKTSPRFGKVLTRALNNKVDILDNCKNLNYRINISKDGKLILRFLLNLGSKNKYIPRILSNGGKAKSTTMGTYKNLIKEYHLNSKVISPFLSNRYIEEVGNLIIESKVNINKPSIYRLIGMINGDGTLTKYGAYFYGNEEELHNKFKEISLSINKNLNIKTSKIPTTTKSYWYSSKLSDELNKKGAILNKKINFIDTINFPKNISVYSEYLSGFYDAEGTIIKDSNIVLPTSVTVHNKNIKILNEHEIEYLFNLAKTKGHFNHLKDTGSKHYSLGIKTLEDKQGKIILNKIKKHFPGIALSNQKILDELKIKSALDLKSINLYPTSGNIVSNWWLRITPIKEVIKFASIIKPTLDAKREKIEKFVFSHISPQELEGVMEVYGNGR